jgi:uncharacterized protein with NRDE domain
MGVTRQGRFAAVTNFRDPAERRSTARTRGALVTEFLLGRDSPEDWLAALAARSGEYNGFNLILGDGESLWYYGSREGEARAIAPGVHGLSNHLLDEPWPKVVRANAAMRAALRKLDPAPALFEALADREAAPDEFLPQTGVGMDWERRLSSPLIIGPDYGTRASTVVIFSKAGDIRFEERTISENGDAVANRLEALQVEVQ